MTTTNDEDQKLLQVIDSRLLKVIEETAEERARKIVEKCLKERDVMIKEQRKKDIKTMTKEFCSTTTAHGVSRVVEADTTRSRIIWTAILVTCITLFVYQAAILIKAYFEYPVNVDIKVVDNKRLTFPSVTVCNNNRLRKSMLRGSRHDSLLELDERTERDVSEYLWSKKVINMGGDTIIGQDGYIPGQGLEVVYISNENTDASTECRRQSRQLCTLAQLLREPEDYIQSEWSYFSREGWAAKLFYQCKADGQEDTCDLCYNDRVLLRRIEDIGARINSTLCCPPDSYVKMTNQTFENRMEALDSSACANLVGDLQDEYGEAVLLCGHVNGNGYNFQHLSHPILTRHVAILPRFLGWENKNLRVEFLGCDENDCSFAHASPPMINMIDPSSISCSSKDCVSNVTTYLGIVRSSGNATCQDWSCPNRYFDFCLEENFCRYTPDGDSKDLVCPSVSGSGLANLTSVPCQSIPKCSISKNEDEPVFPTRQRFYQQTYAAQYCEERGKQLCSLEQLVLLSTFQDVQATGWGWISDHGMEAMFEKDCTNSTSEFCFKNMYRYRVSRAVSNVAYCCDDSLFKLTEKSYHNHSSAEKGCRDQGMELCLPSQLLTLHGASIRRDSYPEHLAWINMADKVAFLNETCGCNKHTPNHARLNSGSSWKMEEKDTMPYIQVDLLDPHVLAGVITQGGGKDGGYVTSFSLSFSFDGNQWLSYKDDETTQLPSVFVGNKDGDTPNHVYLSRAVAARYVLCTEPECIVGRGLNYRGKQNVTRSGRPCQKWNSHDPQHHCTTPSLYPDADLSENYCRNIQHHSSKAPWCFTGEQDWEYCHVERCEVGCVDLKLNSVDGENDWAGFLLSSNTDDYTDITDFSMATREEIAEMGHQKEDLILQCTFDKERCSLDDFKVTQNAKYGNCFTFNHGEDGVVRNTTKVGAEYGLKLTLSIEANEYVGLFGQDPGAKVTIHSVGSTPFPEGNALNTKPGESTFVGLKRSSVKRQPHPYGDCTSYQERDMLYGGRYTYETCQHSCLQAALLGECGCSDELIAINSTLCSVLNKTQECCRQEVRKRHEDGNLPCDCRQLCNEDSYSLWLSSSLWPSDSYVWYVLENIHTRSQARNLPLDPGEVRQNLARVHVYFRDLNYELITENPTYTEETLLSGLGGLLGLYVGLSVITVFELRKSMLRGSRHGALLELDERTEGDAKAYLKLKHDNETGEPEDEPPQYGVMPYDMQVIYLTDENVDAARECGRESKQLCTLAQLLREPSNYEYSDWGFFSQEGWAAMLFRQCNTAEQEDTCDLCYNDRILLRRIEDINVNIISTFCCPPDSYVKLTNETFETRTEATKSSACANLVGDVQGEPCTASQLKAAFKDGRHFDDWGWFKTTENVQMMLTEDGCSNSTASTCYHGVLPTNKTTQRAGLFCCSPQMCVQSGCTAKVPGCSNPLGMESGKIYDYQITASSFVGGHPPEYGRLNSKTPWQFDPYSDENPRFEVNFEKSVILTGLILQGNVETYGIQHSMTSSNWSNYVDEYGEVVLFCGHVNGNGYNFQHLSHPVLARHVAILPRFLGWENKNLRVEFLGCDENGCSFAHAPPPMINMIDPSSISCSSKDCVSNVTTYRGTVRSSGNATWQDWSCPNCYFDFCLEENFCRFAPDGDSTDLRRRTTTTAALRMAAVTRECNFVFLHSY
ncbi:ASIC2 [Branchiostoma lanceolatum]|uniref:ASIC2 protein n=1 Tax=Branchiostoma lanceolatum TaxID=7740 RepID=A0A8J9YT85_BRALA|nr:ASIC2 [Branchiostoma lanceolatum]